MIQSIGSKGRKKRYVKGHARRRKTWTDRDTLHRLHVEEGLSSKAIGMQLGVKEVTVRRWMLEYDVPLNNPKPVAYLYRKQVVNPVVHKDPGKAELERLYLAETMSTEDIARRLGVRAQTVSRWIHFHGIPRRSLAEARRLQYGLPRPTDAELERLYITEGMSAIDIGKSLGVNNCTIGVWLKQAGIPIRTSAEGRRIAMSKRPRKPETYCYVPPQVRYLVLARDRFRCCACGRSPKVDGVVLHVDHIHPASKGGGYAVENLQALCADCNHGKSDMVL